MADQLNQGFYFNYWKIQRWTYFYLFLLEPRMENWMQDVEERIQHGVDLGKKSGFIKSGQPIVCITGWRQGSGSSNTVRIV